MKSGFLYLFVIAGNFGVWFYAHYLADIADLPFMKWLSVFLMFICYFAFFCMIEDELNKNK